MNIKLLTLFCLLLSSSYVMAENHLLFIGGGGEPKCTAANPTPKCAETIFDSSITNLAKTVKNSSWKTELSFNGGHAKTEALLKSQFPSKTIESFSPENYAKQIAAYKAKILSGEITSKDQMMIMINTHGAINSPDSDKKQTSHLIAANGGNAPGNMVSLQGGSLVSLDALQELIELTNKKGIKLGIVDFSCHSGATQALKKNYNNVCVVSATGPNHYSFGGTDSFTDKFLQNLKPGTNLESAFLKARLEENEPSFPMISTDENDSIVAEVYNKITPYLYFNEPTGDKVADYLNSLNYENAICKRDIEFKDLMNKIEMLKSAANGGKPGYNGDELKRLLKLYKKQQDDLIKIVSTSGSKFSKIKETFSETSIIKIMGTNVSIPVSVELTGLQIFNTDSLETEAIVAKNLKLAAQAKAPLDKAKYEATARVYKRILKRSNELNAKYPNMNTAVSTSETILKMVGRNRNTVTEIGIQEKKFYDELYKQKQSLNFNDPCRKITF